MSRGAAGDGAVTEMVADQHLPNVGLVADDCRAAVDHVGAPARAENCSGARDQRIIYSPARTLAGIKVSWIGSRARLVFLGPIFPASGCVAQMARGPTI